jgi:tRNA(Arg) A34 adenosine deaminase TadA
VNAADEPHLRRAIALAAEAREQGQLAFASLLVGPDGDVLAESINSERRDRDITGHPELKLARWAGEHLERDVAAATTMYTSCQPCAMCATAIAYAGLGRVVYALSTEGFLALRPDRALDLDAVVYAGPYLADEVAPLVESD